MYTESKHKMHSGMKKTVVILAFLFLCSFGKIVCLNDRPIIGILSEETYASPKTVSSISASYVKYVESAGARVVPIMVYQAEKYYEDLMSKINGVLFPGGGVPLDGDGYGRSARIIFDIAIKMNEKKDHFPLWGTCLGFEALNFIAVNQSYMKACAASDLASPIDFAPDFQKSQMFRDVPAAIQKLMTGENVTINYHQWCLTPENYSTSGLEKYFKVLSTSRDARNLTYISSIEAHIYPFYGVAFHPEKVLFEWVQSKTHHNIPHTGSAVLVSQYLANFFVNEARKSNHRFPSKADEDKVLIYNFQPMFIGLHNSSMEQMYYFNLSTFTV